MSAANHARGCIVTTCLQLCARPPSVSCVDNTSLCNQAGTAHQLVVATLYDLLFSPWAVTRTEQRLLEVEKLILKTVTATTTDISWAEVHRLYIETIYKNGLGINGFVTGVFTLKQTLDILKTTAGTACAFRVCANMPLTHSLRHTCEIHFCAHHAATEGHIVGAHSCYLVKNA